MQTYTRLRYGPDGMRGPEPGVPTTQMGYEFWPEALEATIRRAWEVTQHVPLFVTENGIATTDDAERVAYVERALRGVLACLRDGIDVRGYIYWSLLDNFEWVFGYRPTFGLVAVDRATQQRTVEAERPLAGRGRAREPARAAAGLSRAAHSAATGDPSSVSALKSRIHSPLVT